MSELIADVRAGRWVDVDLPGYRGQGAMLNDSEQRSATVSWAGKTRIAVGATGFVNTRPVRVLNAGASDYSDQIATVIVEFLD